MYLNTRILLVVHLQTDSVAFTLLFVVETLARGSSLKCFAEHEVEFGGLLFPMKLMWEEERGGLLYLIFKSPETKTKKKKIKPTVFG